MTISDVFIFSDFNLDQASSSAVFSYKITHNDERFEFTERLVFPELKKPLDTVPQSLWQSLHLMLGISYWKLFCPKDIQIEGFTLTKEQASFWNTVYTKGLGELFYKNKVDYRGLVNFPFIDAAFEDPRPKGIIDIRKDDKEKHQNDQVGDHKLNRSLLLIGGGKDSIVSAEMLKKQQKDFSAFQLGTNTLQSKIVEKLQVGHIVVERYIDKQLFTLNKRTDAYNGHIPISAIYAFVGVAAAVLYDYTYVIASNEHSANYGNVSYLGTEINHQWSKTLEFEKMFQTYVTDFITPDIKYFSLLRSMSELAIVGEFVQYPEYFSTFASCNRNFKLGTDITGTNGKWCGECPKCAFVFACLAAFLSKEKIIEIFGKNLFADASLVPLYMELLGISGSKPFECVGTPDETKVAFYMAHQKGEFENDAIMKMFESEVLQNVTDWEKLKGEVFQATDENLIPAEFKENNG